MGGPDFICIGVQKAGTSWLDRTLRGYPDIWLPPVKELHYFDLVESAFPASVGARLSTKQAGGRHWRGELKNQLRAGLRNLSLAHLRWTYRYCFGRRCDSWYRSLFLPRHGQVCGEITPSYSLLTEQSVALIAKAFPKLKVILLMREPVARTWSHVRMDVRRARSSAAVMDDLEGFFRRSRVLERADYPAIIDRWERHFEGRFFWRYSESIPESPERFIEALRRFIGLANTDVRHPPALGERIGVGAGEAIPVDLERQLQRRFRPMIEEMQRRFGSVPDEWRRVLDVATP